MCRGEMLDVDNSHSEQEKVTSSFKSAGGGGGVRRKEGVARAEKMRQRKLRGKNREEASEKKRKGESEENLQTAPEQLEVGAAAPPGRGLRVPFGAPAR